MGALNTKKKHDNAEGMLDGGGEDGPGSWPGANGDNNGSSDSVDAKDTLFLKELATKGQVRWADYNMFPACGILKLRDLTCDGRKGAREGGIGGVAEVSRKLCCLEGRGSHWHAYLLVFRSPVDPCRPQLFHDSPHPK